MEGVDEAAPEEVGQQPPQPAMDSARNALGNYLIRKNILYHAIYQENGEKIPRETIGSLRLVQKSWLNTISELFKTIGDPLYKFELGANNALNEGSLVGQTGQVLDQFVEYVASSNSSIHDIIPTFSLNLHTSFFRRENHKRLYNCLRLCGTELLELQMVLPINGGSLPGIFPGKLSLGRLKTLIVYFTAIELTNMENGESVIAHDSNAAFLLQTILLGATTLTEFQAPGFTIVTKVPTGFQFLALPSTLTILYIRNQMDSAKIELLAECELPHLVALTFCCCQGDHYQNEALYRIFNNFRHTLRFLHIAGVPNKAADQTVPSYRFPVMEKLESFATTSMHCEFGTNQFPSLKRCLAKVHEIFLLHQTVTAFKNWTQYTKLSSVNTLGVRLANGNFSFFNKDAYIHNLDELLMRRLHRTFPNVTILELTMTFGIIETCGLKYLFTEMTQLVELALYVTGSSPNANSVAFWDALLVGVPVETAAGLQASPDIWENVELDSEVLPSIVRLKELKCLKLLDCVSLEVYHDPSMRLISDMAFHYALLKMTKLETLYLRGRFKASAVMTEEWGTRRKTLVYQPPIGAN